jgi:hypothetical protein
VSEAIEHIGVTLMRETAAISMPLGFNGKD